MPRALVPRGAEKLIFKIHICLRPYFKREGVKRVSEAAGLCSVEAREGAEKIG